MEKKTFTYKEQNPEKVEKYQEEIEDIPEEDMVFLDETGIQEFLCREHAYAPRGQKVYAEKSGKKFKRTNIAAAKHQGKLIAPLQYECPMTGIFFEQWFEFQLLPILPDHAVIVMDNAAFHRKKYLRKIAEIHHRRIIFLPPYSPELNPIEKDWAKLKQWLKFNLHLFPSLDDALSYYFNAN